MKPITKREYFRKNNYTGLLILFSLFNIASILEIVINNEYEANRMVVFIPIIFLAAKVVIYFGASSAYKQYLSIFVDK